MQRCEFESWRNDQPTALLKKFVNALTRELVEFKRGSFRVKGDTVDIFPFCRDLLHRLLGDEVNLLVHGSHQWIENEHMNEMRLFPANLFVTEKDELQNAIHQIQTI